METQKSLWSQICEHLSFSQYTKTMGGDMLYVSKARVAMRVSKSKKVHALANRLIGLASIQY